MISSRVLASLVAATVLAAMSSPPTRADETLAGIHVTGTGEVRVVPDMAHVTLEVRREGNDPSGLKAELDQVTEAVIELAAGLDIPERRVTAAAVSIYPRYRRDDNQPDGVIASRTIEVEVDDLAMLGELINGALERGANGINGVTLDASNRAELERQAMDLAIDDARATARRVADRFGVTLGGLKNVTAQSFQQPQPMFRRAELDTMAAADSIAPGETTIRQQVQAVYGIRP